MDTRSMLTATYTDPDTLALLARWDTLREKALTMQATSAERDELAEAHYQLTTRIIRMAGDAEKRAAELYSDVDILNMRMDMAAPPPADEPPTAPSGPTVKSA